MLAVWVALLLALGPLDSLPSGVVEGRVVDAGDGRPLVGAQVVFGDSLAVRTDSEGRFRFAGLRAGTRRFMVRSIGYGPLRSRVRLPARHGLRLEVGLNVWMICLDSCPRQPEPEPGYVRIVP